MAVVYCCMSIYTRYCDRCDKHTTHDEDRGHKNYEYTKKDPAFEESRRTLACRACNRYRSKENLPDDEGTIVPVTATVEVPLPITVHPDSIEDGQSLNEYVEQSVIEQRGEVAARVADGVRPSQLGATIEWSDLREKLSNNE